MGFPAIFHGDFPYGEHGDFESDSTKKKGETKHTNVVYSVPLSAVLLVNVLSHWILANW